MASWSVLRVFAHHIRLVGPFDSEGFRDQLRTGKISFSDFVYRPEDKRKWVRVFEVPELLDALPQAPTQEEFSQFESQLMQIFSASDQHLQDILQRDFKNDWYLQFQGDELGPYSFTEVKRLFESGKLVGETLAWQRKLSNWVKVTSFQNLMEVLPSAVFQSNQFEIERNSETRVHPRRSLVASVSFRIRDKMVTGICGDISDGGIQAIQIEVDAKLGEIVILLIRPISISGIPILKVQAKSVWLNKQSRKMGFKFINELEMKTVSLYLKKLGRGKTVS